MSPPGRPRSGSVRVRNGRVYGSVPRRDDRSKRHEFAFPDEASAWEWIRISLRRLDRGWDPLPPASKAPTRATSQSTPPQPVAVASTVSDTSPGVRFVSGAAPLLSTAGRAWHSEHYEDFERGNADTSKEALVDMEKHLLPVFEHLLRMDRKEARRLVKDWLRTRSGRQPTTEGSPFIPVVPGYARNAVERWLWMLKSVIAYVAAEGDYPYADVLHGFSAMSPIAKPRRKPKVISAVVAVEIAARLHVIHQIVFWLLRATGLRISEAYGLLVASFYVDEDGDGWLVVKAQGGRKFLVRQPDGTTSNTSRKEELKTECSYRIILLAPIVTHLLRTVVEVFHTSPDGEVDLGARLIPTLRSDSGGQAGFRSALHKAASEVAGGSDRPEDLIASLLDDPDTVEVVTPHVLRKNYNSVQAADEAVSEWLRRRVLGHKPADDVNAVYLLDLNSKVHLRPTADAMQSELSAAAETLLIPVAFRPLYSKELASQAVLYDGRLEALGWQVGAGEDCVGTAEAARLLGMAQSSTRRLMGREIKARMADGDWVTTTDEVLAYRDRLSGWRFLVEIAEEAGVDYHCAHRMTVRLGLEPDVDARTRRLLFSDADAAKLFGEFERISALRQRSVPAAEAAFLLGTSSHDTINRWCRTGRLRYDDDRDTSGRRFVTRESIHAELARRGRGDTSIGIEEFRAATGFDEGQVSALLSDGRLVRVRGSRLTATSVRSYFAALRPELLNTSLGRRLTAVAAPGPGSHPREGNEAMGEVIS